MILALVLGGMLSAQAQHVQESKFCSPFDFRFCSVPILENFVRTIFTTDWTSRRKALQVNRFTALPTVMCRAWQCCTEDTDRPFT